MSTDDTGMTTDDTAASEQGADAETTHVQLPPGDEPELAWSVDDSADEMPTNRHGRLIWAALAVLLVAVAGALILLLSTLFGRHTTNNAQTRSVASPPVTTTPAAVPPALVAPPPPAPSVASASPYATLEGKWTGHERTLTVSADGAIEALIPDEPACTTCAAFQMPSATIHIGLTSYDGTPDGAPNGSGKFFGYVKDSSDIRVVPVGVPVEVDVVNASDYSYLGSHPDHTAPGRVVTISINGDHGGAMNEGHQLGDAVPFCDAASAHKSVCGA